MGQRGGSMYPSSGILSPGGTPENSSAMRAVHNAGLGTGTVERKLRVDLVDLPFERHFLLTRPSRLVVQMCSVQAQKLCLGLYRQFAVLPIDECKPLTPTQM